MSNNISERNRNQHGHSNNKKRKRKIRRIRRLLQMVMLAVCLLAAIGIVSVIRRPKIKEELTIEAGAEKPGVEDFLDKPNDKAQILSGLEDDTNLDTVADYTVVIGVGRKEYTSTLHVIDTVAPVVKTKDVSLVLGDALESQDFIESIEDVTKTTVSYVKEPELTDGTHEVELLVQDEGENQVTVTANLTVIEDAQPPVIEGVEELTVNAGGSVSYKRGVTVTDNKDEEVELEIDNSQVNLNEPGDYTVVYTATDAAGNQASVETVVHVTMPKAEQATEELVNAKALEVLASITNESMSLYQKAEAIYWWIHENVGYSDGSPKSNWVEGAYHGLFEHSGDCFVYAMTAKCMLTQAGITNMDIEKIPSSSRHYWNLIDLGDGWYHFDTTRRKDGTTFFYWTDAQLMEYSNAHHGSHNYDPANYPQIQ